MGADCQLIGSAYTYLVQILVGVLALLSLFVKWRCFEARQETATRSTRVWAFDVGKQGFGAGFAHILNILVASLLAEGPNEDQVICF